MRACERRTSIHTFFCISCGAELDVVAFNEDQAAILAHVNGWVLEDGGLMRSWCGASCQDDSEEKLTMHYLEGI